MEEAPIIKAIVPYDFTSRSKKSLPLEDVDTSELVGNLPLEVWLYICRFLSVLDRTTLALTNDGMRKMIRYTRPYRTYSRREYTPWELIFSLYLSFTFVVDQKANFFEQTTVAQYTKTKTQSKSVYSPSLIFDDEILQPSLFPNIDH